MNLLEQKIYETITELKGMSADQITHFLKNYNGIEHESMADGLLCMFLDLKADKAKTIKNITTIYGISFAAAVAFLAIVGAIILKNERMKDNEKINEIVEQLKEAKNVEIVETSRENTTDISKMERVVEGLEYACSKCEKIIPTDTKTASEFAEQETAEENGSTAFFCKEYREV